MRDGIVMKAYIDRIQGSSPTCKSNDLSPLGLSLPGLHFVIAAAATMFYPIHNNS